MNRSFSTYLDLVRFGAAMVVVLHHVWGVIFPAIPLPWPGHHAVVVFFVLSGYVISYAVAQRPCSATDYAVHRAARVLSVAWPALALGAVVSVICGEGGPRLACAPCPSDAADAIVRTAASAAFLGQAWLVDLSPPFNAPYWSLNYEVWYYVLFGVVFCGHGRGRIFLALVIAVLAGPRIIALLPCWLVGVWLQRRQMRVPARWAGIGFIVSILMYAPVFWFDLPIRLRTIMAASWPELPGFFGASNTFAGDYLVAGIVALNFASAAGLARLGPVLAGAEQPIRKIASYTFSIYLYHAPLFALIWFGLGLRSWVALPALMVATVLLGELTETRLPLVRAALKRWFVALPAQPAPFGGKRS